MKREVVYIADLDQDIDDVVAAHYLHKEDVVKLPTAQVSKETLEAGACKSHLTSLSDPGKS